MSANSQEFRAVRRSIPARLKTLAIWAVEQNHPRIIEALFATKDPVTGFSYARLEEKLRKNISIEQDEIQDVSLSKLSCGIQQEFINALLKKGDELTKQQLSYAVLQKKLSEHFQRTLEQELDMWRALFDARTDCTVQLGNGASYLWNKRQKRLTFLTSSTPTPNPLSEYVLRASFSDSGSSYHVAFAHTKRLIDTKVRSLPELVSALGLSRDRVVTLLTKAASASHMQRIVDDIQGFFAIHYATLEGKAMLEGIAKTLKLVQWYQELVLILEKKAILQAEIVRGSSSVTLQADLEKLLGMEERLYRTHQLAAYRFYCEALSVNPQLPVGKKALILYASLDHIALYFFTEQKKGNTLKLSQACPSKTGKRYYILESHGICYALPLLLPPTNKLQLVDINYLPIYTEYQRTKLARLLQAHKPPETLQQGTYKAYASRLGRAQQEHQSEYALQHVRARLLTKTQEHLARIQAITTKRKQADIHVDSLLPDDKRTILHRTGLDLGHGIERRLFERADLPINLRVDAGRTLLHLAIEAGESHQHIVEVLLRLGIDARLKNEAGVSCLQLVAGQSTERLSLYRAVMEQWFQSNLPEMLRRQYVSQQKPILAQLIQLIAGLYESCRMELNFQLEDIENLNAFKRFFGVGTALQKRATALVSGLEILNLGMQQRDMYAVVCNLRQYRTPPTRAVGTQCLETRRAMRELLLANNDAYCQERQGLFNLRMEVITQQVQREVSELRQVTREQSAKIEEQAIRIEKNREESQQAQRQSDERFAKLEEKQEADKQEHQRALAEKDEKYRRGMGEKDVERERALAKKDAKHKLEMQRVTADLQQEVAYLKDRDAQRSSEFTALKQLLAARGFFSPSSQSSGGQGSSVQPASPEDSSSTVPRPLGR